MSLDSIDQDISINNIDELLAAIDGDAEPRAVAASQQRGKFDHLPAIIRAAAERSEACKIGSKPEAKNSLQPKAQQAFAADGQNVCAVGSSTPSHPTSSPRNTPTRSRANQIGVARLGDLEKPWRKLWKHQQLARAFEAATRKGGLAFVLNLSPDREAFLLCRSDPADDLRRRISRELKAAFGRSIPFAFIFEIAPTSGRLHIHGAALPPSTSTADRKLLRVALARAGGRIKGKAAGRQVDLQELEDGFGWASYCQKEFDRACCHLGTAKITFISNDLATLAKSE
jgi:hypothetical protein